MSLTGDKYIYICVCVKKIRRRRKWFKVRRKLSKRKHK